MKDQRKFYKCALCGNLVGLIEDGGGTLVCCGQEMEQLLPNSVDAAQEKHVPAAKRENGALAVSVGSIPHPMTLEHHIAWIVVAQGSTTQRVALDKTGQPAAAFLVAEGPLTVYAYCNLHGLWVAEVQ